MRLRIELCCRPAVAAAANVTAAAAAAAVIVVSLYRGRRSWLLALVLWVCLLASCVFPAAAAAAATTAPARVCWACCCGGLGSLGSAAMGSVDGWRDRMVCCVRDCRMGAWMGRCPAECALSRSAGRWRRLLRSAGSVTAAGTLQERAGRFQKHAGTCRNVQGCTGAKGVSTARGVGKRVVACQCTG